MTGVQTCALPIFIGEHIKHEAAEGDLSDEEIAMLESLLAKAKAKKLS